MAQVLEKLFLQKVAQMPAEEHEVIPSSSSSSSSKKTPKTKIGAKTATPKNSIINKSFTPNSQASAQSTQEPTVAPASTTVVTVPPPSQTSSGPVTTSADTSAYTNHNISEPAVIPPQAPTKVSMTNSSFIPFLVFVALFECHGEGLW